MNFKSGEKIGRREVYFILSGNNKLQESNNYKVISSLRAYLIRLRTFTEKFKIK